MSSPDAVGQGRRILVADEDPRVVEFIIKTLRADHHTVFHAYDGMSAVELAFALDECHLVITNTKVDGLAGNELVQILRKRMPHLPMMYIANIVSDPAFEASLPLDVPILREPFTAADLRAMVAGMLDGRNGKTSPTLVG
jgi:DNA-binding NtrC family response regulator